MLLQDGMRLHLVVARNVLDPTEIKFFLGDAPPETSVQTLLLVAFSRWQSNGASRTKNKKSDSINGKGVTGWD